MIVEALTLLLRQLNDYIAKAVGTAGAPAQAAGRNRGLLDEHRSAFTQLRGSQSPLGLSRRQAGAVRYFPGPPGRRLRRAPARDVRANPGLRHCRPRHRGMIRYRPLLAVDIAH